MFAMKRSLTTTIGLAALFISLSLCGNSIYAQGVGTIIKVDKPSTAKPKTQPARPKPQPPRVVSKVEAAPVRRPVRPKPAGSTKSNADLADDALETAKRLRKDGDTDGAIPYLVKAARLDPKNYEARALLGFIYADQDQLDNALLWANRAVQADSGAYYSHVSLGWVQYKRKNFNEAEASYRTSLRIAEQYATAAVPGVSFELARTLSELRRYRETLPLLEKSVQNDPKDYNTRFFYGVMLQKVGQLNQALTQYREASAINAQDAAPYSNSGLIYYLMGNNAQARQTWEKAVDLGSTYVPDSAGLAILRCDLREARALLEKYTQDSPSDEDGWLLLGDVLRSQRDDSGARMADARAAAIAPEYSGMRRPVMRCNDSGASNNNNNNSRPNAETCDAARKVSDKGMTTLMAAAAQSRTDLIPTILACGINPNATDSDGDAALTYAVASDKEVDKVFDLLFNAGARPNVKNKKGVTPLMIAAALGKEEAARALLRRGADPNIQDEDGDTALRYAQLKNQTRLIALLQNPARSNSGGNNNSGGNCEAARQLNENQATTLMLAAAQGRTDLIPIILNCGINANAGDKDGDTAMTYAVASDKEEVFDLLVRAGGRANSQNNKGITPLMLAAGLGKEEAVRALLKHGADPGIRDKDGDTALAFARAKNQTRIIALLQNSSGRGEGGGSGGNCEAARRLNENQATTLMLAAAQGRADLFSTILQCGVDVNTGDKDNDTALHYSAASDNAATIEALVRAGGRVNARNNNGITPLMLAAALGKEESVKALLARGADVNAKDKSGNTAIDYARAKKQDRIVSLLQKASW
jgi:hypothetical protein